MAYTSVSLPAPAGNGSGAAVDVSAFGSTKTITNSGGGSSVFRPTVTIEISNEASPTKWAPVASFQDGAGDATIEVAARWMRATVSNYKEGSAPTIEVGGEDDGTTFATLIAPPRNGNGAGVDTSALPLFKSVHVAGPFQGACIIEISQDGGTTWAQQFVFASGEPGVQSGVFAADYMRVSRNGVPENSPGLPIVNVGACSTSGGGGGGGDPQRFSYTVTGAEPDLENIEITLPVARSNANYLAIPTQGTFTYQLHMSIPDADKTTTTFVLALSGEATAGDVFWFDVINPT